MKESHNKSLKGTVSCNLIRNHVDIQSEPHPFPSAGQSRLSFCISLSREQDFFFFFLKGKGVCVGSKSIKPCTVRWVVLDKKKYSFNDDYASKKKHAKSVVRHDIRNSSGKLASIQNWLDCVTSSHSKLVLLGHRVRRL